MRDGVDSKGSGGVNPPFGTKTMRRLRAGKGHSGLRQGEGWYEGDDYTLCGLVAEAFETKDKGMALICSVMMNTYNM